MDGIQVSFRPATENDNIEDATVIMDVTSEQVETTTEDANIEQTSEITEEQKNVLKNMLDYVKSGKFKESVQKQAKKTGIPASTIAKGALHKIFGIVADILGIVVSTACQTVNCLISILESVLKGIVTGIETLASGLIKVATFNQSGVIA